MSKGFIMSVSRNILKARNPMRPLLRKALEKTVFREYRERIERFNWNARLVQTLNEFAGSPVFTNRDAMYRHINFSRFCGGETAIDFMEFGVFRGDSLRKWCRLTKHPESRLFGFDSFEGLPEDWIEGWPKGTFDTGGKTPEIDDPRVRFVVGSFQNSLPSFLATFKPKNRIVIHSDCDLYSSTLYCLTALNGLLPKETVIIFDDFHDPIHEYRALSDYCSAYRRRFRIISATERFRQVAVELLQ
jgi:O-methyltransferase